MSLRKKLISSISALCLMLAVLVVGVWAVSSLKYNMAGTVSFIANGVNIRVYDSALTNGTYEGQPSSNVIPTNKMNGFEIDTYNHGSEAQYNADTALKAKIDSWMGLSLYFLGPNQDDEVAPLQITFKVQNTTELADQKLQISVKDKKIELGAGSKNVTLKVEAIKSGGTTSLLASTQAGVTAVNYVELAKDEVITIRLTFSIDDTLINAELNDFVVPMVFDAPAA